MTDSTGEGPTNPPPAASTAGPPPPGIHPPPPTAVPPPPPLGVPAAQPALPPRARPPVQYQPQEPGWWYASDGRWYPPESAQPFAPLTYVTQAPKSRVAAGLLNIFLPFGVGRFYLGYSSVGVGQLLVAIFTCGLGGLWSVIDGIMILTGNPATDAEGRQLQ